MGSSEGTASGLRGRAEEAGGAMRQAKEDMRGRAGQAADSVEHAPDAAMERTRGNPLGAGLIAFGAGVVAAGLLPDTRSERRVTAAVSEQLEPVKAELGEAASEVGQEMAGSARESAQRTAEHAKGEARETVDEVRGQGSSDSPAPGGGGDAPPGQYPGGSAT